MQAQLAEEWTEIEVTEEQKNVIGNDTVNYRCSLYSP